MHTAAPALELKGVAKAFTMHLQGGATLPVVNGLSFTVASGSCVALGGRSGTGKSSVLKMIFGSYGCDAGAIIVRDKHGEIDVATASPREILRLRATTLGYVSQFLRVIPRVSALDVVAGAGRDGGLAGDAAQARAEQLLARLNIPRRLWNLAPQTFSGGEQQRVNIARGFAVTRPVLLLDEPTASLDGTNRAVVVELLMEAKAAGAAILGVFHDDDVRALVADEVVDITQFTAMGQAA